MNYATLLHGTIDDVLAALDHQAIDETGTRLALSNALNRIKAMESKLARLSDTRTGCVKEHNGGSAFPMPMTMMTGEHIANEPESGMTLRDYFAAKAMQAAATNPTGADGFTFEQRAAWSYAQADAMLKARTE